ncbi:unnamed protein product [Microthlaspi erraticum]|uniref:Uncharacterized protein n=1 Tax=Microthlaspi erraticum TaxID=1685480 RepID=A0A6D2JM60_9BRAS|nr:unnamed protein product [Microthlaspi erraticum]
MSTSNLEYEELKGFMDLELVKKYDGVVVEVKEENRAARPCFSEAWDVCGGRKGKRQITPEIKWRIPAPPINEVELKDHLKHWAHAAAFNLFFFYIASSG